MSRNVSAPPVDRSRLPEPGLPRAFTFPPIRKVTLPNGLRVWHVRHSTVPIVTFTLLLRRGAADDPRGKEGLAALTADMLDEGSQGRSTIDVHEELARLGAQLDSDIGSDAALVSVAAVSRFAAPVLHVLADIVARPALEEADFQRVRQLRLHRLMQLRDMPSAVADRIFIRLLFGEHPYGHTPLGHERSLSALTLDDVREFHASAIRPSEATLIVVGDCDFDAVESLASEAFDGWEGSAAWRRPSATPLPAPARLNLVPRPGAPQSELRMGHVGVARSTPDYHALVAANMVLGGQFVSRINLNLREDKGLTYGAHTSFDCRRLPGPFMLQASVQTEGTVRAIEESLAEIAGIRGPRRVTAEELSLAVAALTRGYARNFETAEQVARAVTQIALYDLPDAYFTDFVPQMTGVTVDDVTRVAAAHIDPSRVTTLIVGDPDRVGGDLPGLNLGEAVILPAEVF
jgi:predicted Zn-dependent peptidase